MSNELEIVNPLERPNWEEYLLASQGYSFFHSASWAQTLREAYGFSPRYFVRGAKDGLSVLIPVMEVNNIPLPKKGVSLPFTDASDSIVPVSESWRDLFKELTAFGRNAGWKSVEIRGGGPNVDESIPFSSYHTHVLEISKDAPAMLKNVSDGTRSNIRKAEREGIVVTISDSHEALNSFYGLHSATRRRHGLPPQPKRFFTAVHNHVLSAGKGYVVLAKIKSRPVAGAVFFHFGTKAIYKYSASDPTFQNARPNNLVLWEAIRRYSADGFTTLSLGRTDSDNLGLRHYKSSWGAREEILRYYKFDIERNNFVTSGVHVPGLMATVFRALPLPVLNVLGSVMYKYVA
jgi:CelD/BcsL family acetyltransferase involved in cellulose biosynthesis